MNNKLTLTLSAIVLGAALSATAYAMPPGGGQQMRGGPPQEAIDACEGKSEGESVSFTSPHGDTINGTCRSMRGAMIAVPEGRRRGGPGGPGRHEGGET